MTAATGSAAPPASPPRFGVGQRVRVLKSYPPGHRRTPAYIRGSVGVIERWCGAFPNPEERAYGFDGHPRRQLYRVRFRQADVWTAYDGSDHDVLDVEIFEHWLQAAAEREEMT